MAFPLHFVSGYDPSTDKWCDGPSLIEKRSVVVCAVVGTKLYAVGGYDGQAYLKTTEIFDPELNWYVKCHVEFIRALS